MGIDRTGLAPRMPTPLTIGKPAGTTRDQISAAADHRAGSVGDEQMNDNFWNSLNFRAGTLDALARVDLLAGDPVLDRRLAALADADPLGLHIPRRYPKVCALAVAHDGIAPEHHAYRLPTEEGRQPFWRADAAC
jgi:hypothetical protein